MIWQSKENIKQNLTDAGFDPDTITKFLCLEEQHKTTEQLRILAEHRQNLLNIYHEDQRKIDCLDYLIFNIHQRNETDNQETKNHDVRDN